ncbi:lipoprotein [Spiroplasma turonicum]|uniref:Lipoprotein n=1 Tax=Spiroplasma turonicum TaxID=216946 RepID=A0A0K1P5T8_9MOLU|nr:lipoprotein [Spiroplasma turonicum]AKU79673.1 hypothetical protein STURON_00427 [Spiroplasma turonicum]ALX70693.1 hypothetical protein STURO_v1c04250 [Spiroplasma turonicum]
MKKLLSILTAIGIIATTGATAVSCSDKNENGTQIEKKDLSTLETKNLGKISGQGDLPDINNIVDAINNTNKDFGLKATDVDFDGSVTTTSSKIKAKDSSTSFIGSVEVTYEYKKTRSSFDLALIESVVNNKGLGEIVRPSNLNTGKIMVPDLKNTNTIFDSIKLFVKKTLDKAKELANIDLNLETLINLINIDFKDTNDNSVNLGETSKNDISKLVLTVKEGHENDVDGYTINGKATIVLGKQENFKDKFKKTDLDSIEMSQDDFDDSYTLSQKIIYAFTKKNSVNASSSEFVIENINKDDKNNCTAIISTDINSTYTNEPLSLKFKVTIKSESELPQIWNLTEMENGGESLTGQLEPIYLTTEEKGPDLYRELFEGITNVSDYDAAFPTYWESLANGKKYFFDNQGNSESIKGTASSKNVIDNFETIFDIVINKSNPNEEIGSKGTITLTVKNNSYKLDYMHSISGSIKIYYSLDEE